VSQSHTPGPWVKCGNRVMHGPGGTLYLCDCSVAERARDKSAPTEETFANAALIAAAPEMLAFVRLIAGMTREGEKVDGERFEPTSEDCIATLNELITQGRKLHKQAHP